MRHDDDDEIFPPRVFCALLKGFALELGIGGQKKLE